MKTRGKFAYTQACGVHWIREGGCIRASCVGRKRGANGNIGHRLLKFMHIDVGQVIRED